MKDNKWVINRAGLVNFWYYDEEEFQFSEGRMLLRGTNGSGKSVTMQSFIPLLLDGNKSPERLDPFGSKARKMENYLLGEDENGKDESIGYLFMEFMKEKTENFITIGMGLKAARGKSLDSWGFCITDGRRIGRDFLLYKDIGEKVPLTQKELRNRIGSGGTVANGQKEYMKLVNDLLFGFPDIDEYDELIKLLVQLRTPKLSKEFKPTVVYEIMNNSLQPLSDDDLRPMSEAIEHMDGIKSRLDVLIESKKAGLKLRNSYDQYNRFMLYEKAKDFVKHQDEVERLKLQKQNLNKDIELCKAEFEGAEENVQELTLQRKAMEEKRKELEKHDSVQIKEKINEIEEAQKELTEQKKHKEEAIDKKKAEERRLQVELKKAADEELLQKDKVQRQLYDMDEAAEEFKFHEQSFVREELLRDINKEYSFGYVKNGLNTYGEKLSKAQKALNEEQYKNKEYDRVLAELEGAKHDLTAKQKKHDEARVFLMEIKEELIEKVHSWNRNNTELLMQDEDMVSVTRQINSYGESTSLYDIDRVLRAKYNFYESILNKQNITLEHEKKQLKDQQQLLKAQIKEWEGKKDPEPQRDPKVILNRERLAKEGIPYVPLYMALDFSKELTEGEKGRIEEALLDIGILDALIVPEKYKQQVLEMDSSMADKYLFPSPRLLSHDLSAILRVDKTELHQIALEYVEDVLRSIMLNEDDGAIFIKPEGEYGFGILRGKATQSYLPKFIGGAARKRYKQEMIENLNRDWAELGDRISGVEKEIEKVNSRFLVLKQEIEGFPDKTDIEATLKCLQEAHLDAKKGEEDVTKKESAERKAYSELRAARERAYESTRGIELSPQIDVYNEAIATLEAYRKHLYELESLHGKLLHTAQYINMLKENAEKLEEYLEEALYDLNAIERRQREAKLSLDNLNQQLKLSDYEEIKREINECLELLRVLPDKILEEGRKGAAGKEKYERMKTELYSLVELKLKKDALLEIYRYGFEAEFNLGYVYGAVELTDKYKQAKDILKETGNDYLTKNREDLTRYIFEKYNENKHYMTEYNLKLDYIFENKINTEGEEAINAMVAQKRLEITGRIRGKQVNFYKLMEMIEEAISDNERLLRENDRQLFEDVLAKNISRKIRSRISHSELWVDKMNSLMESMDTSSGLSFSLNWKSKKAESEGQLDTQELVQLLKHDGSLLKEEDLNRLSEHFRSKIAEAKRLAEESGKVQSFHTFMKEILDYRKWFEFKLFFKKTGETKKELTNNAFDRFSGGEKAMAMYVPLFAAVYARYEGGRQDCPRVISLDEAFAGVDENNIKDMFRLLNELKLNYVINSQVLWGDYDTVPSLSICELVRPNNANFVTVIRYRWNGKVKQLITNGEMQYG